MSRWSTLILTLILSWLAFASDSTNIATVSLPHSTHEYTESTPALHLAQVKQQNVTPLKRIKFSRLTTKKQLSVMKQAHSYPGSLFSEPHRVAYALVRQEHCCAELASPLHFQSTLLRHLWSFQLPSSSHRLGGWKESNTLYTGSLTFHI